MIITLLKKYQPLLVSIAFAFGILIFRVKLTNSFFFIFLVWNLFLAALPYCFSQLVLYTEIKNIHWTVKYILLGLWLLFLPNSPYIITDFIHLQSEYSTQPWLDLFIVFVFALNGLLLGLLSMLDIHKFLQYKFDKKTANGLIIHICILSGFGIYLGRFLRFNSWDLFTKPQMIMYKTLMSLKDFNTWAITLAFAGLLWILFWILKSRLIVKN